MELTQDEVIRILRLIDESPMGRVSLQIGELKLEVTKGARGALPSPMDAAAPRPSTPAREPAPAMPAVKAADAAVGTAAAADPNLVAIRAPLLGIFYPRPQPGSPPFVEEGSVVEENSTVALIEVMKLFNPVKAGVKGRIRKICAKNNDLVQYDEVLFLVEPE